MLNDPFALIGAGVQYKHAERKRSPYSRKREHEEPKEASQGAFLSKGYYLFPNVQLDPEHVVARGDGP